MDINTIRNILIGLLLIPASLSVFIFFFTQKMRKEFNLEIIGKTMRIGATVKMTEGKAFISIMPPYKGILYDFFAKPVGKLVKNVAYLPKGERIKSYDTFVVIGLSSRPSGVDILLSDGSKGTINLVWFNFSEGFIVTDEQVSGNKIEVLF